MLNFFEQRLEDIHSFKETIKSHIYVKIGDLQIEAYLTKEPLPYNERTKGKKVSLHPGDKWGNLFDCAWFHFTGGVPADGDGKPVVLLIDVNGEACVFDSEGNPVRGLTNGSSTFEVVHGTPGKRVLQFSDAGKKGQPIDIWADAGCNDLFGVLSKDGTVEQADIAIRRDNIRSLYYDYWILSELSLVIDKDSARYARIIEALYRAMQVLQTFEEDEIQDARNILAPELNRKNGDPCLTVSGLGNAHIDLAWLWPQRESVRKAARTFSTALDLMQRYPDYKFGGSQPQLFEWVKQSYPVLYDRVKEQVKKGRWEVHGGMWVEADTNMPSGESLVRQFLYGKQFFKKEFEVDVDSLWLPDAFGYSAALPQIMKMFGVRYFMTQKLSWNSVNKFPHYTFYWKGIDGTKVLAHMLAEETYNSHAGPRAIAKIEKNYAQKHISDRALLLFGIGDGGGGPGEEHLEQLDRLKNLSGLPPVEQEYSSTFFRRIDREDIEYPVWQGELYLEKHQGTYTTQALNKKYNRLLETKLHDLEFLSSLAMTSGFQYPQETIDQIWKEVLLYQFHDILPGSSIRRVHAETIDRYRVLLADVMERIETALRWLSKDIHAGDIKEPVAVFNTLSWCRSEWVKVGSNWFKADVGPMGWAVVDTACLSQSSFELVADSQSLENDLLTLKFDRDGALISMIDKVDGFSFIKEGQKANVLKVYIDKGDAWDFSRQYRDIDSDSFKLQEVDAYVDGPQAVIEKRYTYCHSTITQKIMLTAGSRRVDFITDVEWNETFKMLRAEFPVNIFSDYATCDIQFGSVKRPTHKNTSWDDAKFEICAHKYIDLSQKDHGVALLNDCKYGFSVIDNIIDINLLRSPINPDTHADKGEHHITYALFPHKGDHVEGGVARAAYELNVPLVINKIHAAQGQINQEKSFLSVDHDAIFIETVKKTQVGDEIIIRLYENQGGCCTTTLTTELPVVEAWHADGMEKEVEAIQIKNKSIQLDFRPWEIKTVKFVCKA